MGYNADVGVVLAYVEGAWVERTYLAQLAATSLVDAAVKKTVNRIAISVHSAGSRRPYQVSTHTHPHSRDRAN